MHTEKTKTTMVIEAPLASIWYHLTTASGMNDYLTDRVNMSTAFLESGTVVHIVIGDMLNEAVCTQIEPMRSVTFHDHFKSLLADDSYLSYQVTTTFLIEPVEEPDFSRDSSSMYAVSAIVEGYESDDELLQWIRECADFGWKQSLFNLKTRLELGLDLRQAIFGYPRLGICNYTATSQQLRAHFLDPNHVQGNWVMEVFPDGPASLAGLQKGDIIVALDQHKVPTYAHFVKELSRSYGKKDTVDIQYVRRGTEYETTARLSYHALLTGLVEPTDARVNDIRTRE
ncbi:PDZ domain-containing protein [Marinicrinis sediminis]|uniref:PDZ domain-containing protein n=1 Tax=Marinicrinis sediminis TaxID=1652465 RepID=A0ABW5RGZ7_9BACL